MKSSAPNYKRARPACGTFLKITLAAPEREAAEACEQAFALAARLEKIFSRFDSRSELSAVNRMRQGGCFPASPELATLVEKALRICEVSEGAFNPFYPEDFPPDVIRIEKGLLHKEEAAALDLTGIAKGELVDHCCLLLTALLPGVAGSVEAGGDLRHFGAEAPYTFHLRTGTPENALLLPVTSAHPAAASSGLAEWNESTTYAFPRASGITVLALAPSAALADAATKIGLALPPAKARAIAHSLGAEILVFDKAGRFLQNEGGHETIPAL